MNHSSRAIGIFDSGLGGLTVMKQIMDKLPHESLAYLGDTARVPYGNKSGETILRYSIENTRFLLQQEIKTLVIACNTATAYSLQHLQNMFEIPIIGVIDPGVEKALAETKNNHIAVLGTKGTIRSGSYQRRIEELRPGTKVTSIECPLFVPLVEELLLTHPATELIVKEYLSPIKGTDIDTVLLGCTHYPMLRYLIEKELGEQVSIIDSASTCAEKLADLLHEQKIAADSNNSPMHRYFVSDDPLHFHQSAQRFLQSSLTEVKSISFV